jgi:hypothetical protein
MAAQRRFAELDHELEEKTARQSGRAPSLASSAETAHASPARLLQEELRRAFNPGPIASDQFSTRRALKFIAPTGLSLWVLLALVGHIGHH